MIKHIFVLMKTCEIRCRPQSARLHTLWTAVLIRIAVNLVFDTLLMKRMKSPSESKWLVFNELFNAVKCN